LWSRGITAPGIQHLREGGVLPYLKFEIERRRHSEACKRSKKELDGKATVARVPAPSSGKVLSAWTLGKTSSRKKKILLGTPCEDFEENWQLKKEGRVKDPWGQLSPSGGSPIA